MSVATTGPLGVPQADAQQRKFDEFVRKLEADFAAADVQVFAAVPHGLPQSSIPQSTMSTIEYPSRGRLCWLQQRPQATQATGNATGRTQTA